MDLRKIFAPVAEEMDGVERALKTLMRQVGEQTAAARGKNGIIDRIVQHPFTVPGKRIRPAIVLLVAHAANPVDAKSTGYGGAFPDANSLIAVASSVEVLHAASLVHDDIIDSADSRRHQVSLNKRFGNRVAVLAGDILYTHFFSLITGLSRIPPERRFTLLDMFLDTTKAMCTGEILAQEASSAARPLTFEQYLEIATDKTAVLFAACFKAAALLCSAGEKERECLGEIGMHFGLSFQMADDVVDKDHGLDESVDLRAVAEQYADKARKGLQSLPATPHRDSLRDLVDYVIGSAIP
jgi:geranylgeranyl pyrophosphate synthase